MGDARKVELVVQGMTCGHCVAAVKGSLSALPGVTAVEVTLDPPRAGVTFDPGRVTVAQMTAATAEEGYPSAPAA